MKREFLEKLGLEKDVIDQIMDENGKDINKANGKLELVQKQLDEANNTIKTHEDKIKELSKVDASKLQEQIEKLQTESKQVKEDYENKIKDMQITSAIKEKLTDAQDSDLVAGLIDRSKLTFKDNAWSGIDEQVEGLKKDKAFLFKQTEEPKPSGFTPNQGAEQQGANCGDASVSSILAGIFNSK